MPVDYSKWDNLELSDDSDIEVHPNVDKKSFIRAKQNQIHQQRIERKNKLETYKYERSVNDGFRTRLDDILKTLQSHSAEAEKNPDEFIFQATMELTEKSKDEKPPVPPPCVQTSENEVPSYSMMAVCLLQKIKTKIEGEEIPEKRYEKYIEEIKVHISEIDGLQKKLQIELDTLEKEAGRAITSESYHTGFEKSMIAKPDSQNKSKSTESSHTVELLNPNALPGENNGQTTSSGTDPSKSSTDDDDDVEISEIAKEFSRISINDYKAALQFISTHPEIVAEKETDGLLVMAFNLCLEGKDENARRCVHHGLLLQYCRALGRDGVGIFFKRITTPGHQAQKVFYDDVNSTIARIKIRAKEIQKQRAEEAANGSGGVEAIQLHAVDPGTTINIKIPPLDSNDPIDIEARKLFEGFNPELQKALESGSLDEVNKVLGKMKVEEAEEIVGQLGKGNMLSLEEEIIDATTEEGRKALKIFEEQERTFQGAEMTDELEDKYANDPE
ncbi:Hsp90 co-chaperone Cdc37 [Golovinomyces cichoracearum]|uniref:Hsp90 chaperone protein kinase-targeting subunit n=1 Tax=Golovinomyces cichoracearum TaxID=62708 RepID=A0A420I610_9PEZI|nr:Hsp90 co-chaperone Cdc37 [Golovinomyces cichoracearum]